MITGAVFDFDGTLVDSMGYWAEIYDLVLDRAGLVGHEPTGDQVLFHSRRENFNFIREKYGVDFSDDELNARRGEFLLPFYRDRVQAVPGAKDFLGYLEQCGVPMTLTTATDRVWITPAVERLGFAPLFDHIVVCGEHGISKSHPEIFLKSAELMGSKPENTVVFEDALYAIRTAYNAGFITVGVYDRYSARFLDEIKKYSTFFCMDYGEVRRVMDTLLRDRK